MTQKMSKIFPSKFSFFRFFIFSILRFFDFSFFSRFHIFLIFLSRPQKSPEMDYEKALQKIAQLEAENKMKDEKIAELEAEKKELRAEIFELKSQKNGIDYPKLLDDALKKNQKLREENAKLKAKIVDLHAQKCMLEDEFEQNDVRFSEIYHENQFNKKRVQELEQSNNTLSTELKRVKAKFEITSLEQFMEHYGKIMDRGDIKIIQEKCFEETGIKYSVQQLKSELEQIGFQVKRSGTKNTSYVSKDIKGVLYIVQLKKHKDTSIYKVGRTIYMKQRLSTYKRQDGGATEIQSSKVNNQYKAEAKLLQLLNDAVDRNELKKDKYGDEYFEGSLDVVRKYYDEVVKEFKDDE